MGRWIAEESKGRLVSAEAVVAAQAKDVHPPLGICFARVCVELAPESVGNGEASDFRLA